MANSGEFPYASPIAVVGKKDGNLRMCVDYMQLYQMLIKDASPLPRIDEIFASLQNAYCFFALELLMGYNQNHALA